MAIFGTSKAEEEVNRLQKETEKMLQIDEQQVEIDQEVERDLEDIYQIVERDGEAINAVAEVNNAVDLGRALNKHGVERSLADLHSDFKRLREDIQNVIKHLEEKREDLRKEAQIDEKEEQEFGELGEWSSTLQQSVDKLAQAQENSSFN
jgi:hypothetical protein